MEDPAQIASLVLYVVDQLNDMGRRPSTIQLVKYLYLIDIEHHRALRRPLTGLRWVYHKYGPYAFELPGIAKRLGYSIAAEEFTGEEGKGVSFKADREARFPAGLKPVSQSVVDRVLRTWGMASTREILDYVYFDTEPMIDARVGGKLDLSLARPEVGAYQIDFHDTARLRELRERLKKGRDQHDRLRKRLDLPPDEEFYRTLDELDNGGE